MKTGEFQKCHYCEWRKGFKDTPLDDIYQRSLKQVRKAGFSYTSVQLSDIHQELLSTPRLSVEDQRRLGLEACYRHGEGRLTSLEFRELVSVMGFALHGKRVLEFSGELGECLLRTDLNIKTSEVRVIYPSVYVVIPEGIDFFIPTDAGPRRIEGIYTTCCRDEESDQYLAESGGRAVVHDGRLIPVAALEARVGREEMARMMRDGAVDVETMHYGGLYVLFFCVARDGVRQGYRDFTYHFFQYAFPPDSEACLVQDIVNEHIEKWKRRAPEDLKETVDISPAIASLIFNLFMYMGQEKPDVAVKENWRMVYLRSRHGLSWEAETEVLVKYAASGEYELVEVGRGFGKGTGKRGGGVHESPAGHWRRGHWHRYWVGPRDVPGGQRVEFRWIQPLYVRGREEDQRAKLVKVE